MAMAKEQIRQLISENNINSVADVYTLLKDSFKDILQELMEAELDATLGYEKNQKGNIQSSNKRNGHSSKTLKSQYGEFEIDIPRDRNGEFEPKLIPKYQRDISGIEEKVISLYARGMSTRDIHDQLQDLYGIEISAEMVSKITDKILPEAREWQSRPLNPIYPFIFMDCIRESKPRPPQRSAAGLLPDHRQNNNAAQLPAGDLHSQYKRYQPDYRIHRRRDLQVR